MLTSPRGCCVLATGCTIKAVTTTLLLMVISHKFTDNLSVGLDVGARWGPCACSGGREAERLEASRMCSHRTQYEECKRGRMHGRYI